MKRDSERAALKSRLSLAKRPRADEHSLSYIVLGEQLASSCPKDLKRKRSWLERGGASDDGLSTTTISSRLGAIAIQTLVAKSV